VVLMVHIDMAKYQACSTDAERSTALRQDMRNSARGDFAAVANFLLALKAEDAAFLYEASGSRQQQQQPVPQQQPEQQETVEEVAAVDADAAEQPDEQPEDEPVMQPRQPRRQAQHASAGRSSRSTGSSMRRAGIAAGLLRRFKFDFELAPGSERIFALANAQPDAPGAPEGSAFLEQLMLSTPGLRQDSMLGLLHKFEQQHQRLPVHEEQFQGEELGSWCSHCRAEYHRGVIDAELAAQLELVPGWALGQQRLQERKAQLDEEQGLQLLQRFQQEHGRIPTFKEKQDGWKVGAWCQNCRARQLHGELGELSEQLQRQLDLVPGWWWSTPRPSWDDSLQRLHAFVDEHHRLPRRDEAAHEDSHLGAWVENQRKVHRALAAGKLSQERAEALSEVPGWRWAVSGMQLWMVTHSNKCRARF
jgi:hypothetical protein